VTTPGRAGRKIRVLDLFAGAGGLSTGLQESGSFETVAAVEMDLHAAATFSLNHPEADVYVGPIQDWLETQLPIDIDVIIGGPPCQGFSTLGKQDAEDDRNDLWREYARTLVRVQPSFFVVENVAAFLHSPQFDAFLEATAPGGMLQDYHFDAQVLNAANYGAAQTRKRAVIIGHHRDLPFPGWPEETHLDSPVTVEQKFIEVHHSPKRELPERQFEFNGQVLPGSFTTTELHITRHYTKLSLDRFACIPRGGNRFNIRDDLLAPCWRKHTSGSGDVMGRLHLDKPAVTIRTEFFKPEKGRYLHPTEHRAITHYEAALLQGFPVSYKWAGNRTSIARQIGNAVPIPLGTAIGNKLAETAGRTIPA
jgi:DNA (cytosine-5)-methyltransferase 1